VGGWYALLATLHGPEPAEFTARLGTLQLVDLLVYMPYFSSLSATLVLVSLEVN